MQSSQNAQVLQQYFAADEDQDDPACQGGFVFIPCAKAVSDKDPNSRNNKGGAANDGRRFSNLDGKEGKCDAHRQRVDAGGNRHQQQFFEIQRRICKVLFLAALMQGIPYHLTADKQQQQKSNPVVIAGDVLGKTAAQQPPQKRHQCLKAAEK